MALLNSTLAAYGAKEVAAMGITQKIYSIVILAIVGLFMNDAAIVNSGSYMLFATLITTPLAGVIMVYTTVFQSIGNAWGALIMSLARQGVVYFAAMLLLEHILGLSGRKLHLM